MKLRVLKNDRKEERREAGCEEGKGGKGKKEEGK
jgi:hypothetical protein